VYLDVVLLRHAGRPRLRADVLRQLPMRGEVVTTDTGARCGLIATLTVAGSEVWRLSQCRVSGITGGSLVLAGVESTTDGLLQRQAWWCRLPGIGEPRPFDPSPPSAVARDLSYAPA
jgi:hypothetical protein